MHIVEGTGQDVEDKQSVRNGLIAYNRQYIPESLMNNYQEVCLFIKDDQGTVVGGMYGTYKLDFIAIDIFWLDESLRKLGYGSQIINRMEQKARELGCKFMKLDTFSFQARGFYEKHGFTVYGQIDDVAGGHTHYYLLKRL
jgi:GNAT superfamily N-acetyltransferase